MESGSDDDAQPGPVMLKLVEKAVASPVQLMVWCSTMDLITICTQDGQLHTHRAINWQRLWTLSPDAEVTCVCWSPEGKRLAVGHVDGLISIIKAETGEVCCTERRHRARVVSIAWGEPPGQAAHGLWKRIVSAYPHVAHAASTAKEANEGMHGMMQAASNLRAVVCSADEMGRICLSGCTLYEIASFELQAHLRALGVPDSPSVEPLQVGLSSDLRHTYVLYGPPEDMYLQNGEGHGLCACALDVLGDHPNELLVLAVLNVHLPGMVRSAEAALKRAASHWREAMGTFRQKMNRLHRLMLDMASENADMAAELMRALTCGDLSDAMTQWLATDLNELGLKQMSKAVDTGIDKVHTALLETIAPALECATFMLDELHGQSLCPAAINILGLESNVLEEARLAAARAMLRVEQVRLLVSDVGAQYRRFFSWLLRVMREATAIRNTATHIQGPVPVQEITAFLRTQFEVDAVEPQLTEAAAQAANAAGQEHGAVDVPDHVSTLLEAALGCATLPSGPLETLLSAVRGHCATAGATPGLRLSPQVVPAVAVSLSGAAPSAYVAGADLCMTWQISRRGATPAASDAAVASLLLREPATSREVHVAVELAPSGEGGRAGLFTGTSRTAVLPGGATTEACAAYSDDHLLLLKLPPEEEDELADSQKSRLVLLDARELPRRSFSVARGSLGWDEVREPQRDAAPPLEAREHEVSYTSSAAPLAVSAQRGLACVASGAQHVAVYDLEGFEEGEEEEEEEDGSDAGDEDMD